MKTILIILLLLTFCCGCVSRLEAIQGLKELGYINIEQVRYPIDDRGAVQRYFTAYKDGIKYNIYLDELWSDTNKLKINKIIEIKE